METKENSDGPLKFKTINKGTRMGYRGGMEGQRGGVEEHGGGTEGHGVEHRSDCNH